MKRLTKPLPWIALVALLLCLMPLSAPAGAGYLRAYADASGTICDLYDPGGAVLVYLFHELHPGDDALGSRFSLSPPPLWTFLTFVTPYVVIGIPTTDIAVGYGGCVTTRTPIGHAVYFSAQPSAVCSQVAISPPAGFGSVLGVDCSEAEQPLFGSFGLKVNPDTGCCCDCIATEQSTWGSVKALYR